MTNEKPFGNFWCYQHKIYNWGSCILHQRNTFNSVIVPVIGVMQRVSFLLAATYIKINEPQISTNMYVHTLTRAHTHEHKWKWAQFFLALLSHISVTHVVNVCLLCVHLFLMKNRILESCVSNDLFTHICLIVFLTQQKLSDLRISVYDDFDCRFR